jgi:putative hemolysin
MTALFEIMAVFALAVFNGLLAMSEIAVVSSRKARLQELAEGGDGRAEVALDLASSPTRFLSTVQIGITLVGILAGALGGATIAREFGVLLRTLFRGIPVLIPYADAIALGMVVLAIAYLSLVIGELVPKRLALTNPERIASMVARPMQGLSRIAAPIVRLLSWSTDAILRLFGLGEISQQPVTEQEVRIMLEEATEFGVFDQVEEELVKRVFRLGDQRISALMTYRTDIAWLDVEDPPERWLEDIVSHRHAWFPVARQSLENVLGIVRARDLLAMAVSDEALDPKAALHAPVFVPESAPALEVLQLFKESRQPLALVIDEFGGLEGLLTISDVLEAIVGEIPIEGEAFEPEAVRRADGSWLLDGMMPIEEVEDLLEIDDLPGEEEGHFETLGGFVMASLGRIPTTADHFQWRGLCFEVMDMDGHRVDKVLVAPLTRGACQPSDVESREVQDE